MQEFILRYGLLAVFLGTAVEGDVSMILSGVAAHLGLLDFPLVVATGWLGACVADCVCYAIGRNRSVVLEHRPTYQRVGPLIERLAGRLGPLEIIIARFVYGTRVVSMLFWGTRRLPFWRFVVLDVIGGALWASVLASLGFAFSGSASILIGRVRRAEIRMLAAVAIVAGLAVTARVILRRRLRHRP